jgi:outer membrane protein OmpA-like peptidoglycan-associated protein
MMSNMKKLITLIILTTTIVQYGLAQEQLTKRQQADKLFERYEYSKSLSLYLELTEKKYNLQVSEHIAGCYREMNKYEDAERWYSQVVADPNADIINTLYYGDILLRDKNFEAAKNMYKLYYAKNEDVARLAFKLATCDSAAKWIKQLSAYVVKNEAGFNGPFSDWGLTYYGKTGFVFTSDRKAEEDKKNKDTYPWTGSGYFKLYQVQGTSLTELPLNLKNNTIVTGDYHVGPVAFNAAADTAYLTITTVVPKKKLTLDKPEKGVKQRLYTRRLQLVIATKKDNQWGNFKSFAYNNVDEYSVGHAALSTDGNVMYFTSDMPGGFGKTDIWYCEKQKDGSWGKPVNCGKNINTKDEEAFPTINQDNLFYSSKGLPGMGGFDLFEAKGVKANWEKPVHLPYPVNSTSDDLWYISKDGASGYFSSNRENGQGDDDIYSFSYKQPVIIAEKPKTVVPDNKSSIPEKVETGKTFILSNIYYDLDKSNIRYDAAVELDKLVALLKQYPTMHIELSSHTDSRASFEYNIALSQRRAASAVAYLVAHGIDKSRMIAKGYGESRLVNQCSDGVPCTEAEHQLNRRTEVKVISQ